MAATIAPTIAPTGVAFNDDSDDELVALAFMPLVVEGSEVPSSVLYS